MSVFRLRRFSLRVLALLLALLFATLATTYQLVSRANAANAREHARASLELGARVFETAVRQRIAFLAGAASVMSGDDAIKQVLREDPVDTKTLNSNLESYTHLVGAPVLTLFDTERHLLGNTRPDLTDETSGPFAYLIRRATEKDMPENNGFFLPQPRPQGFARARGCAALRALSEHRLLVRPRLPHRSRLRRQPQGNRAHRGHVRLDR